MEGTYAESVLEGHAADGQRLEELGNGLAAGLRARCCAGWGGLRRGEVGDARSGLDIDIGVMHFVV